MLRRTAAPDCELRPTLGEGRGTLLQFRSRSASRTEEEEEEEEDSA